MFFFKKKVAYFTVNRLKCLPEFLKEIIINYVVQDIENFDFGNIIIAPKGSGYLYLNYGNSVFNSDAGTYFFPKDTAMPLFDLVLKQLNEYMSCKIQENKWERVTIHRRV